jgi:hypothetical protein
MVTTTKEQAGTPSQPTQTPHVDDFPSLLAAVPPAKADALKERIYDWLEKREQDAETAIEKAKARATIVEEQNRIVRMELQDVENGRLREEAAATRRARAGLFAEAMSALNAAEPAAPKEGEVISEEENDDEGVVPADYQQPADSPATTHPLQPLGTNIGKKVHAGDTTALDIVIKELLDEVLQLREGASANVARIILLEEQLHAANDALATHSALLDEALTDQQDAFKRGWGTETSTSQNTSQPVRFTHTTTTSTSRMFWGDENEQESQMFDPRTRDDAPLLRSRSLPRNTLGNPDPIRGYLDDEPDASLHEFDACFKKYADMMLVLQLKGNGDPVAYHEVPWPVLPYTPEGSYPVPRWRARYAEKEAVDKFVEGFLASKHAELCGSLRDDWLDLLELEYAHEDNIKAMVQTIAGYLD